MNSKTKILIVLIFIVVFCNLVSCMAPQTPVPAIYVYPVTPTPEKNSDNLISGEKLPEIKPTRIFVDNSGWKIMYRFDDTFATCYVTVHFASGSSSVPFCFERK